MDLGRDSRSLRIADFRPWRSRSAKSGVYRATADELPGESIASATVTMPRCKAGRPSEIVTACTPGRLRTCAVNRSKNCLLPALRGTVRTFFVSTPSVTRESRKAPDQETGPKSKQNLRRDG